MLKLKLDHLFKNRNVEEKYRYLKRFGFTHNTAFHLSNGHTKVLNCKHVEKLCRIFQCTPNDLLEWIPDTEEDLKGKLPLKKLMRTVTGESLGDLIKAFTDEEIQALIEEIRKRKGGGQ